MKKELYAKGLKNADFSAEDYTSEYNVRTFGLYIADEDAPATLVVQTEMNEGAGEVSETITLGVGWHPISLVKILFDGSNTITTCLVFY